MTRALLWLAIAYGAFKFAAMLLARPPGFGRREASLAERLRAGEPLLFVAAFVLAVPLALLWGRHADDIYSRALRDSTGCYGNIVALKDLPQIRRRVGAIAVYDAVEGYQASAYAAGADMGVKPEAVRRRLAEAARKAAADYAELRRQELSQPMAARLGATLRCLQPAADAPNA